MRRSSLATSALSSDNMISSVFTTAMIRSVTDAVAASAKRSAAAIARAHSTPPQPDSGGDGLRCMRCMDNKFIDADVETAVSRATDAKGNRQSLWSAAGQRADIPRQQLGAGRHAN